MEVGLHFNTCWKCSKLKLKTLVIVFSNYHYFIFQCCMRKLTNGQHIIPLPFILHFFNILCNRCSVIIISKKLGILLHQKHFFWLSTLFVLQCYFFFYYIILLMKSKTNKEFFITHYWFEPLRKEKPNLNLFHILQEFL